MESAELKKVVPILRKLSMDRKTRAFFMRKSTARLMERLTNAEQDAMIQIAVAWNAMFGSSGFRQMKYGETYGRCDAHNDYVTDLTLKFRKWTEQMMEYHADSLGVCISVCAYEHTLRDIDDHRKRWRKFDYLMQHLHNGLTEWGRISGWKI